LECGDSSPLPLKKRPGRNPAAGCQSKKKREISFRLKSLENPLLKIPPLFFPAPLSLF
jgi:hypothetical protein